MRGTQLYIQNGGHNMAGIAYILVLYLQYFPQTNTAFFVIALKIHGQKQYDQLKTSMLSIK